MALTSTEVRGKLANQSASLISPYCHQLASRPELRHLVNTCTELRYLSIHLWWNRSGATLAINHNMIDNVYTTPVAYDMNTKKDGIGHTQHREGDFKFVYVRFLTLQEGIWNFRPKGDGRSGP